ncbi:hypothetical protein, partial [Methanocalculus sp.]|uniref:hypothetical protein n=1 Tax=Methanocalculus sp. TaxID=2004547 RepID=UPI0027248D3C
MDPRRILLQIDPGMPGIADLIGRIPGVREVILHGEEILEIPGVRIRRTDEADHTGSKATLVISRKSTGVLADLLLIPQEIPADTRSLTDQMLIWMRPDQASHKAVTGFLDQITTKEVLLLTEGETVSDLLLHIPEATFSRETISGDPLLSVINAASAHRPTLIMVSGRLSEPDRMRLLDATVPVFIPYQRGGPTEVRELRSAEFPDASRV